MKSRAANYLLKYLPIICLSVGFNFSQQAVASEHETACSQHIQDKIAWDDEGRTKWETANIEQLCKGTTVPKEPGECFHKVMTGHVKWGSSDKWEWKNAINLCAGTSNSEETITCFKNRVTAGETWDAAVFQCQSNKNHGNKVPM